MKNSFLHEVLTCETLQTEMKTRIFEIAILFILAGCVSVSEEGSRAIGEAFGEGFGHIIKDYQSLLYSVVWHYRANEKWPETREDLVEFIELRKAPIDLSKFTTIEFNVDEKGDLEKSTILLSIKM